jgi:hypothetical protein
MVLGLLHSWVLGILHFCYRLKATTTTTPSAGCKNEGEGRRGGDWRCKSSNRRGGEGPRHDIKFRQNQNKIRTFWGGKENRRKIKRCEAEAIPQLQSDNRRWNCRAMESLLRHALSERSERRTPSSRASPDGPGGQTGRASGAGRAGRPYPRARVWHVSDFHSSLSFLSNFLSILPNPKDLGKR